MLIVMFPQKFMCRERTTFNYNAGVGNHGQIFTRAGIIMQTNQEK